MCVTVYVCVCMCVDGCVIRCMDAELQQLYINITDV